MSDLEQRMNKAEEIQAEMAQTICSIKWTLWGVTLLTLLSVGALLSILWRLG